MSEYYDKISEGYNELHGEEQKKKAKIIADELNVKPYDTLLDVGCGTGIATELFNCKKTGVDPAKDLLKQCKFKTVNVGAEDLPFPYRSFDYVVSITAVHNFHSIQKGIEQMFRVAKKAVVVSVLKKSKHFGLIKGLLEEQGEIYKTIDEEHDIIFFCKPIRRFK
jgi:ubiquinone/menaquinone biosynthesis C-methylase UbiE